MTPILFITGTDTEIGKTIVTAALTIACRQAGIDALAVKPLATGIDSDSITDAQLLQKANAPGVSLKEINPITYKEPISPNIAAQRESRPIITQDVITFCQQKATQCELLVVEGVGGLLAPINEKDTIADVMLGLNAKVVVVTGLRLGCMSHTLLTQAYLENKQCDILCHVANHCLAEFAAVNENIATLKSRLDKKPWVEVPFITEVENHLDKAAAFLAPAVDWVKRAYF